MIPFGSHGANQSKAANYRRVPRLCECRSSRRSSRPSANDPGRRAKRGGMYQLRNSRVPSEWAPACWVRRLVKPLLVLPDEFQGVEKVSERVKEFSN